MKTFAILALFAASAAANGWGQSEPVVIRMESNSYSAPQKSDSYSSYSSGSSSYGEQSRNQIPITRFNHDIRGSVSDSYSFETGNGISQSDNTQVVQGRGGSYDDGYGKQVQYDSTVTKNGAYSYTAPDGQHISTTWNADENGFRAEGAHLPKPVEMPAEHAEAHRLANARASSYGSSSYEAPQRNSYEAPQRSSYEAPMRSSSYEAPAAAPVIRVSYEAPPPQRSSY